MSQTITVQSILDDAAARFGDPRKTRVTDPDLLQFYNDAMEETTRTWGILEQDSSFDWLPAEDRYAYPDDQVLMTRLRYNLTPSDSTVWRDVTPYFEDEFRGYVDGNLPTGEAFLGYWARPSFFEVTPRPTISIPQGGLLTYWRVAVPIATATPTTFFELPNAFRKLMRDRVVQLAQIDQGRDVERAEAMWRAAVGSLAPLIEKRADDAVRRSQFRPRLMPGAAEAAS